MDVSESGLEIHRYLPRPGHPFFVLCVNELPMAPLDPVDLEGSLWTLPEEATQVRGDLGKTGKQLSNENKKWPPLVGLGEIFFLGG